MTKRSVPVVIAAGLTLTLVTLPLLSGCGSGNGHAPVGSESTNVSRQRGTATFTVAWPERNSRVVPVAANSIVLTMTRVTPGPSIVPVPSITLTRPAPGQPLTTTYTFQNLELGGYVLTATAYPTATATGTPQATGPQAGATGSATVPVTVVGGANTPLPLVMFATIKSIVIAPTPLPPLAIGQGRQLTATAFDGPSGTGNVVITTSAIQWTTNSPNVTLSPANGNTTTVTGAGLGGATVTATYAEPGKPIGAEGTGASSSIQVRVLPVGLSASAPWVKFHGDAQNTGQAGLLITGDAVSGTVAASFATPGAIYFSSPVIDASGNVYVGAYDGNVYSLKRTGGTITKVWSYATGGIVEATPAISASGYIYAGSYDGNVYALPANPANPNNVQPVWTFQTPGVIHGSPTVGADGTVYVGSSDDPFGGGRSDNTLYAIDGLSGQLKWKYKPATSGGMASTPALSADGRTVYIGSQDGNVYALATNQPNPANVVPLWVFPTGGVIFTSSPVVANVNGNPTVFIGVATGNGATNGKVFAINAATNTQSWVYDAGANVNVFATPATSLDGSGNVTGVYIGVSDTLDPKNNRMLKLDPTTGVPIWRFPGNTLTDFAPIASSALVGHNGAIYFGAEDGHLYSLRPDGTPQSASYLTGVPVGGAMDFVDSSPGLAVDGTIYVGNGANNGTGTVVAVQ